MLGGGCASGRVRAREVGGASHGLGERGHVERVDEDAGLGWDELGRAADACRHDRAARGHSLEERLTERLDQ